MTTTLAGVAQKQFWSKDVCIYIGTDRGLAKELGSASVETLDLVDLLPSAEDLPADDEGRSQFLQSRLDSFLEERSKALRGRCIVVIKNAALLARYRTGLRPVYDWFGGDRTMVVLLLSPTLAFRLPLHLGRDVKCDCNASAEYLATCLANPKLLFRERQ